MYIYIYTHTYIHTYTAEKGIPSKSQEPLKSTFIRILNS